MESWAGLLKTALRGDVAVKLVLFICGSVLTKVSVLMYLIGVILKQILNILFGSYVI